MRKLCLLVICTIWLSGCATTEDLQNQVEQVNQRVERAVDEAQESKRELGRRAWCVRLPVSEYWAMSEKRQSALRFLCSRDDAWKEPE